MTGTDLDVTVRTQLEVEVLEEGDRGSGASHHRGGTQVARRGRGPSGERRGGRAQRRGAAFSFPRDGRRRLPRRAEAGLKEASRSTETIHPGGGAGHGGRCHDDARPVLTGVYFEATKARSAWWRRTRTAWRCVTSRSSLDDLGLIPARALRELDPTVAAKKLQMAVGSRRGLVRLRTGHADREAHRRGHSPTTGSSCRRATRVISRSAGGAARGHRPGVAGRRGPHPDSPAVAKRRRRAQRHSPGRGGETEHVTGEYQGEEMTIAFNSRYLNDGVGRSRRTRWSSTSSTR